MPVESGLIDGPYSLFVSALWLDKKTPKEAVDLILKELLNNTPVEYRSDLAGIAGIGVIRSDDKIVMTITSLFNVTNGELTLRDVMVGGIRIDYAIILEAVKPPQKMLLAIKGSKKKAK